MPDRNPFTIRSSTFAAVDNFLPSEEERQRLTENILRAQRRLERARELAEEHIDIDPPWDYDPNDYSRDDEAIYTAMKWTYEGADSLESTGDEDLQILADRIKNGFNSVVDEIEDDEVPYKGLYLLISSLDGLIIWLCENDPSIDPAFHNDGGDPIYNGPRKKQALEDWYEEYAIFGVEDDDGTSFKDKWENYWYHRHRIMHGSTEAFFDEQIAIATLFFVGLTIQVVNERHGNLP